MRDGFLCLCRYWPWDQMRNIHLRITGALSISLEPKCSGGRSEISIVLEHRIDGKRTIRMLRLERNGVGRKDIELVSSQRCAPTTLLSRSTPVLVVSPFDSLPSMLPEQLSHITTIVEVIPWPAFAEHRRWNTSRRRNGFIQCTSCLQKNSSLRSV